MIPRNAFVSVNLHGRQRYVVELQGVTPSGYNARNASGIFKNVDSAQFGVSFSRRDESRGIGCFFSYFSLNFWSRLNTRFTHDDCVGRGGNRRKNAKSRVNVEKRLCAGQYAVIVSTVLSSKSSV